jgi:hypothetical protein
VIFFDRSPFATAIVTSAMLRTCAVRFDAIEFTDSVRSFHTPVTSETWAWPPSLPSVPTSRATRVTSEVKTESCLIIVLTIVAERRNSPFSGRPSTSSGTVCRRSPFATAVMVRVTAVVGQSRSSISVLTDASMSPQAPWVRPNFTRVRVLPSRPTTWPTRSSCCAMRWFAATMSLKVSATLPARPVKLPGSRTEKSPTRIACRASSSWSKSSIEPSSATAWPFGARSRRAASGTGLAGTAMVCAVGFMAVLSMRRSCRDWRGQGMRPLPAAAELAGLVAG